MYSSDGDESLSTILRSHFCHFVPLLRNKWSMIWMNLVHIIEKKKQKRIARHMELSGSSEGQGNIVKIIEFLWGNMNAKCVFQLDILMSWMHFWIRFLNHLRLYRKWDNLGNCHNCGHVLDCFSIPTSNCLLFPWDTRDVKLRKYDFFLVSCPY